MPTMTCPTCGGINLVQQPTSTPNVVNHWCRDCDTILSERKDLQMNRRAKKKAPQRTTTGTKHQQAKKPAKPAIVARGKKSPVARHAVTTTRPANGSPAASHTMPAPDAIRAAAQELGEMRIDRSRAADQMLELGEMVETVEQNRLRYESKAEAAKIARKTYEGSRDHLFARLRECTHPAAKPLLDLMEREQDHQRMLDSAQPAEDPPTPQAAPMALVPPPLASEADVVIEEPVPALSL